MEAKELVRTIRTRGGLTRTDLARMAGVAASTVSRIERGELEPTWSVMNKLLESAGYRPTATLCSRGDVSAVVAAREALGETVDGSSSASVRDWTDRWKRAGLIDGNGRARRVEKLGIQAGIASRIFDRPNPRMSVIYDRTWQEVAAAFSKAGLRYAVSGITATSPTKAQDGAAWPLIYVDSVPGAVAAAGLTEQTGSGPRITLLGLDDVAANGTCEDEGYTFVSPGQALIDSYAGPGRMADLADAAASRWQLGSAA